MGLVNHVTEPTRVTGTSAKVIDLFLSTVKLDAKCEVLRIDISDHFAILGRLAFGVPKSSDQPPTSRSLYKVNWKLFNRDLQQAFTFFVVDGDLDCTVDAWYHTLFGVLDRHATIASKL